MKTTNTWLALITALALLALAALAASCGRDDTTSAYGDATDAAFITDMTAHHQGAVEMAEIAQKRGEHAEVRKLADDIISAQQGEASVMKRIGDDMHAMGMSHASAHMGMSQSEMGMDMNIPLLRLAEPFDRAFIDMMVPHHMGAIAMARKQLAMGSQSALRKMAKNVIDVNTEEIAQMRTWRKAW